MSDSPLQMENKALVSPKDKQEAQTKGDACKEEEELSADLEHQDSGYFSRDGGSQHGSEKVVEDEQEKTEADTAEHGENVDDKENDEDESVAEQDAQPPDGPFVQYKHLFVNKDDRDDVVFSSAAYSPIDERNINAPKTKRQPVFEVISTFTCKEYVSRYRYDEMKSAPESNICPMNAIRIRSPALVAALRCVIGYYPGLDLSTSTVKIDAPYRPIVHHYDQLRNHQQLHKLDNGASDAESNETFAHLELLLSFLDDQIMPHVEAERARNSAGRCTFHWLWIMFKPGTDVTKDGDNGLKRHGIVDRNCAVVSDISGGPVSAYFKRIPRSDEDGHDSSTLIDTDKEMAELIMQMGGQGIEKYDLNMWCLGYNGHRLGRVSMKTTIKPFDGTTEISKLEVVPMEYARPLDCSTPWRDYKIAQGRKYYSYLKPSCMQHAGEVMSFPFHEMNGKVMVDAAKHIEEDDKNAVTFVNSDEHVSGAISGCTCSACEWKRKNAGPLLPSFGSSFRDYDDINPHTKAELTDHQYLLCPQVIPVWFFGTRKWSLVDVSNLQNPEWKPDLLDTLVLSDRYIRLLKALSQGFMPEGNKDDAGRSTPWTADFVKGKGNARIFLLHGPPGVGKSYTAGMSSKFLQCMAEFTRRPLMILTCSDIGTGPIEVEQNLEENFKKAKKWGAMILIDEADIYLERREKSDLTRNSLVAGFLRALEVYEGILFLTTNRVGAFDDAFISRIHVKLFYAPLKKSERKRILGNFVQKLLAERGDQMSIEERAEDYMDGDAFLDKDFNGREIRNIFQTAVGLAEFDNIRDKRGKVKLLRDHVTQVVEMSGDFKNYLKNVWDLDEAERAEKANLRRDMDSDDIDATGKQ